MSSLFARKQNLHPDMLTLPAFCIPAEESAKLQAKREAQLQWMRAKGVEYILSSPVKRHTPAPPRIDAPTRGAPVQSPRIAPLPQKRVA